MLRMWAGMDLRPVLETIRVRRSCCIGPTLSSFRLAWAATSRARSRVLAMSSLPAPPMASNRMTSMRSATKSKFLTGTRPRAEHDRVLATILFTDVVGSTQHTVELGDRRWRDLIARHDDVVRRHLVEYRGVEVNTMGDAFLARFDGPAAPVQSAVAVRARCDRSVWRFAAASTPVRSSWSTTTSAASRSRSANGSNHSLRQVTCSYLAPWWTSSRAPASSSTTAVNTN